MALGLMIALPFLINGAYSSTHIFLIQVLILLLTLGSMPADAVLLYHFPVFKRFTYASFLYALARAMMYIVTSFGVVYLIDYFDAFGLWFITLPVTLAYLYGVFHFERLEKKTGNLIMEPIRHPS